MHRKINLRFVFKVCLCFVAWYMFSWVLYIPLATLLGMTWQQGFVLGGISGWGMSIPVTMAYTYMFLQEERWVEKKSQKQS